MVRELSRLTDATAAMPDPFTIAETSIAIRAMVSCSTNTGMHMALISRTSSLDIFMSFKISPPLHAQAVDIKII